VVAAIGSRSDVVLVAQSLAGFVSPLVAARVPLSRLVFVNAMLPLPGETAGEWGAATVSAEARIAAARRGGYSQKFDDETYFFHDVPRAIVEQAEARYKEQSEAIFDEPCRFERWPDVPIQVIAGRDDRLFPIEFQRRIARERLGLEVDEIAGGHLAALSNPRGLVAEVTSR
jgi:pimeloyl-ACP methyl ester carboxylesterase